jgi:hypothetical protein
VTPNIPIAAWAPDGDPTIPGVMMEVENLRPTLRGYAPEFSMSSSGDYAVTLGAEPLTTDVIRDQIGNVRTVFCTTTTIQYIEPATTSVVDRTRSGGGYAAASAASPWRFASFGNATLACHPANPLQGTAQIGTTAFSNVSGAPQATTIACNRNFVVIANFGGGGSTDAAGWRCSALEDYTDWTVDIATQAAGGTLTATPGPIVRLIAWRDYILAFKGNSFYRGQYVGAAANTWSWPVISTNVGLIAHDAICEADGVLYWIAQDGVYRWAGGAAERIRSAPWGWMNRLAVFPGTALYYARAVWDPVNRLVRFVIKFPGDITSYVVSYHPDTDRWGYSTVAAYQPIWIVGRTAPSPEAPSGDTSWPLQIGWVASADLTVKKQGGTPGESSFTTGDIGDDDEAFTLEQARVRYLSTPTTSTATHSTRDTLDAALTVRSTNSRLDGKYDLSHAARWHRVKFTQTGRYEATGFRVGMPKSGRR